MASFDRWWTTIESDGCLQKLDKCPSQECSVSKSLLFNMFAAVCQGLSRSRFLSDHDDLVPCKFYQQLTIIDQIDNSDLQEGASTLEVDVKKVQEELVKQGARIH